jgi:hypothetical protein
MDLEKLAEFCKKHRVTRLRSPEYELEFDLPPTEEQISASAEVAALMAKANAVSDEDILFNSNAGLENIDADYK